MSVASESEPVGPHDPTYYAPRRLREEREQRLAAADDIQALREKRPDTVGRKISPPAPLDSQVENEAYEFVHPPLDADVMSETRALVREMERRGTLFGVTVRMVAAIGIAAIIALFFVVMVPTARQPDSMQSFFAAGQSSTAALSQHDQSEDVPKPALAEFRSLLASGDTAQAAERAQPEKESDKVLQQFLQWRQKRNPSESAQ
jgi:hypothetical protein